MDFSYFKNIMKPNDFAQLNKLDKYNPESLFFFVNEYPKIIDLMLKYFKANPKKMNEYEGYHKSSLLMNAAFRDIVVKNICELNINVNYRDLYGWTALTYAAFKNNISAVKVLLEFDADANIRTNQGSTVINYGSNKEKVTIMVENIRFLNVKN